MASKSNLKFYLTNAQSLVASIPSHSLGGYPSNTEFLFHTALTGDLAQTSLTMSIANSIVASNAILIGDELIKTAYVSSSSSSSSSSECSCSSSSSSSSSSENLTTILRGWNTIAKPHLAGTPVYASISNNLFNNSFNSDFTQYRCIAVKNISDSDVFYNLRFYFRNPSLSTTSTVKMAIEVPRIETISSMATGGTTISLVDTTLSQDDNYYSGAILTMTSGSNNCQSREIAAYDYTTRTITFVDRMCYAIENGDTYIIQNAPSQAIVSGMDSPTFDTTYVSPLATSVNSIDYGGRVHGTDLYPNEVVYLWLERHLDSNANELSDNRVIFTASYSN